jgi:hypothetical protein
MYTISGPRTHFRHLTRCEIAVIAQVFSAVVEEGGDKEVVVW